MQDQSPTVINSTLHLGYSSPSSSAETSGSIRDYRVSAPTRILNGGFTLAEVLAMGIILSLGHNPGRSPYMVDENRVWTVYRIGRSLASFNAPH